MNPLVNTDSYKLSHKGFMNEGTTKIYSNLTARSSKHFPVLKERYDNKVVFFGLQKFIIEYLIEEFDNFFSDDRDWVMSEFKSLIDVYLGEGAVPMKHFEALHDLGYLPIEIKAVPEGSLVNIRVPFFTITNTHPDFAWLTNYLETVISCELWKPITIATLIREFRKLVNEFAIKTTGSLDFTMFQLHDFSFRGMSNRQDAMTCGMAFLLYSCGTDTIPAIYGHQEYYAAGQDFIGTSVPASEHSVACLGTSVEGELESYRKWITQDYPTGIVSLVSDTYDYWRVLTEYLPALKDDILARPENELGLSKVVIRPDSGDPADIVCGLSLCRNSYPTIQDFYNSSDFIDFRVVKIDKTYFEVDREGITTGRTFSETEVKGSVELLWETFGGTVTEQGYKVLDSHIGLIYGDSITLPVMLDIFQRLEAKGFASTNVVFGIGSYTMQYLTRDSLGMAIKATYAEVDGKGYELFKDPITDNGMKKSAKGLLRVEKEGDDYVLYDQQTTEQEKQGELKTVFKDGQLVKTTTLSEIRQRLWG